MFKLFFIIVTFGEFFDLYAMSKVYDTCLRVKVIMIWLLDFGYVGFNVGCIYKLNRRFW